MIGRFVRCFAALVLAVSFAGHAAAAEEFQKYAFTQATLDKYMAASTELKKLPKPKDKEGKEGKEDPSVDDIARDLDSTPGVKPILSRHGFASRDFALATLALFNAGFYLAMEPQMDKKGRAELLASYPKQMQGNIELLRRNPQYMKQER